MVTGVDVSVTGRSRPVSNHPNVLDPRNIQTKYNHCTVNRPNVNAKPCGQTYKQRHALTYAQNHKQTKQTERKHTDTQTDRQTAGQTLTIYSRKYHIFDPGVG